MKIKRTTASDWFKKPGMKVPFEHLALTELITGVCIECLAPFQQEVNKIMRFWQLKKPWPIGSKPQFKDIEETVYETQ